MRCTSPTMRSCASVNASPPGNRNCDGARWTVVQSRVFRSGRERAVRPPSRVHLDQRRRSGRTSSRLEAARGSTVCTHRSSGLE